MITLYTGTPGSGKSFHVAKRVYNLLKYNRCKLIISNVNFNFDNVKFDVSDRFVYVENQKLSKDYLEEIINRDLGEGSHRLKEGQYLLILDEAQLLFNSRDWLMNDKKGWIEFFSQHRKMGFDIILVAQYDMMIDKQIRAMIEYEVLHRKVKNYGFIGFLYGFFCGSFLALHTWYGIKQVVEKEFIRYNNKIASLYDTYQVWRKS